MLNFIEENIENNISLELLSEVACLSKFHLLRVFKNLTDITIMDYVRSRKLTNSLNDLLGSNLKIIDVALKYGFDYEQTFIRSFKNQFGVTPASYRKKQIPLNIIEKINLDQCLDIERGIIFSPKFIVRPEIKVMGIKHQIYIQENLEKNIAGSRGVDFFENHRGKIKNPINPNVYIGLTKLVSNDAPYNYYLPSIEVVDFSYVPEKMDYDIIPSSKYAVFHYIGNHAPEELSLARMKELYNYIYQRWIPLLGYDFMKEGGFRFEEVDSDVCSNQYCEAKIHLPINSEKIFS